MKKVKKFLYWLVLCDYVLDVFKIVFLNYQPSKVSMAATYVIAALAMLLIITEEEQE